MVRTNEIEADGTGVVVVRRGTGAEDAARLRTVGARLAVAAHPGVVEVRGVADDPEEVVLRLGYGGRPVDQIGALTVEQVAGLAAAVAEILADLHAAGVVHGALDTSHVLVGSHGRPRLCGFGPLADPPPQSHDDVAAVGALIVTLLGSEADLEPIPDRRWHRGRSWTGWSRRSLLMVADQAAADPPSRRPSARRLAAAIAEAVPAAALAVPPAADTADESPSRESMQVEPDPFASLRPAVEVPPTPRTLPKLAGALAVVAVVGLGTVHLTRPMLASDTVGLVPPTTAPPTTPPPTTPPPTTEPSTTTTSPSIVVDGTTVSVEHRRYQVGQPGDVVVVGDWDGDDVLTPAALRPATGEVFVFFQWADDGHITVDPITIVADAAQLIVQPGPTRDALVVVRVDGSRVTDVLEART